MNVAVTNHPAKEQSPPKSGGGGFTIVRILLGLVMLAAAGFKVHALWTDPYPPLSLFSTSRWQVAFIELETLLGLWLLIGAYRSTAWLAALAAFGLLAASSLYLAIAGQPSCGCFGKLSINPWYTFGLDLGALAALSFWRPTARSFLASIRQSLHNCLRATRRQLLEAGFLIGMGILATYSIDRSDALAAWRGDRLSVEPAVADIGSGVRGETRITEVRVHNHTDRSVRVLGGSANCKCITIKNLPLVLPPRGSEEIQVQAKFWGANGDFQQPFELYTDDPIQPVVYARFGGYIVEPSQERSH